MAIKLQNKTNVEAPSANYPYGRIVDDPGDGTGTPVDVQVYGDFHQFFARLLASGAVGANGLPDNLYDGFQYYQSLWNIIKFGIEDYVARNRPFLLTPGTSNKLNVKVIQIGDWNMDSTDNVNVAHGLTLANIRNISVVIRDDGNTTYYCLPGADATLAADQEYAFANASNVNIKRRDSGIFDNASFDQTSYNRGWITIMYES